MNFSNGNAEAHKNTAPAQRRKNRRKSRMFDGAAMVYGSVTDNVTQDPSAQIARPGR